MKRNKIEGSGPSEFKNVEGVEYFDFEEDFVEENIRCIPMLVRFKLDLVGIKLKLNEWSKFSFDERKTLLVLPIDVTHEKEEYERYLRELVTKYTGKAATDLAVDQRPAWADVDGITEELRLMAVEHQCDLTIEAWKTLTNLQRFALVKLCRPGHENKNFPKAIKEFGLK
jgi:hypothetical protein